MKEITYQEEKIINSESLLELYEDAGWIAYTKDLEKLQLAIAKSLYVLTARDKDKLVGLVRVVGDGLTIIYIQDILVLKKYKRKKIGMTLMTTTLDKFKDVRQKVLLTEDTDETRGFYEALGFESCDNGKLVAFAKL